MSALPRPDLPPGPHRDLMDALHDLHHHAGWPSLRRLAREAGVSHTTVSHAFSSPRLPSWGTLELLVEAMDGDVPQFHDLWIAATSPSDAGRPIHRIAGRRAELAVVRRHLETGSGLLLVTGEAGIGKTALVEAAAVEVDSLVVSARCLPLSQQTPLMPVVDLLRGLLDVDGGRLLEGALVACPDYVRGCVGSLVPEVDGGATSAPPDEFARQRLFAAIRAALAAVSASRPVGVVLDDLHWADPSTLDLVEYLATKEHAVGLVGSWRERDPDTSEHHRDWVSRVRRQAVREEIALEALDREGTAAQLTLLLGGPATPEALDAVFERSGGHPLFTTHLAAAEAEKDVSPVLSELLDNRLGHLTHEEWGVVRVLGLAGRPLSTPVLAATTALDPVALVDVLRALSERWIIDPRRPEAALAHPLVAEGVRRRLVPGEAEAVHSRLAHALSRRTDASPAEVAAHHRAAGEHGHELRWRLRAAGEAHERTAPREEAEHLLRALAIWSDHPTDEDRPARSAVELGAVNALNEAGQEPAALALASAALGSGTVTDRDDRFEIAFRAAAITWGQHGPARAIEALDDAEEGYGDDQPPDKRVRCLRLRASLLSKSGHIEDAVQLLDEAAALCDAVPDHDVRVGLYASRGWHLGFAGDLAAATRSFEEARANLGDVSTVRGEAFLAMMHTDVLLHHGRPPEEVEAAARVALEQIELLDLRSTITNMVRSNVAEAWVDAGRPSRAERFLLGEERSGSDYSLWPLRCIAARIAIAGGALDEALDLLGRPHQDDLFAELSLAVPTAEALLWSGRPDAAATLLGGLVRRALVTDTVTIAGPAFVMLARALADAAAPVVDAAGLRALRCAAVQDPLGPGPVPAVRPGCTAQWEVELVRGTDEDTVDRWLRAATEWDRLIRPHDAAYCRWRAAQVALRQGRATHAGRLLARAAADAHEHVPLHRAIATTAAGGR